MYQLDFHTPISVHFIGIGGISMSGLAKILLQQGFTVSGSDDQKTELTKELADLGATVYRGLKASNIKQNYDLVVYTAAIHSDNPEFQAAVDAGIPMLTRAQLLGQLMTNYKNAVNVSGTHGKTTTTSMFSHVLLEAGKDPTISVGGILPCIGSNFRNGGTETFLTEACEYTNSFLDFNPTMELILNIEEDHLDFFKDIDDIRHSFRLFAEKLPENGFLVINNEIDALDSFLEGLSCQIVTYGEGGDIFAGNISYNEYSFPAFDVYEHGNLLGRISLQVPGAHNVSNALAVIAGALKLNIPFEAISNGLYSFTGTKRRFELKGHLGGITIIDDYAHHPTEIRATLTAAQNYPHKRIVCVFQSHTYSRTKAFLKEFAQALTLADLVVMPEIYAAREVNTEGISSRHIQEELTKLGTESYFFETFDEVENFLLEKCFDGDLLITMGAGDVVKIGENLLGR